MAPRPNRTRFAPSPTGSLHVGGVRTALYCLLEARHSGGRYIVRIEDTDRARSTEDSTSGILTDLQWMGLEWDEGPGVEGAAFGPYLQSGRLDLYRRMADVLVQAGHAYEAWETTEELTVMRRAAEKAKQNFRYRRRVYTDAEVAAFRAEGRTPVLRFASPAREMVVEDEILGTVTLEADTIDDFVIVKADGWPTYHLAVVIDDHHMDISMVLRGQEHLMNSHKHALLYEAFGWEMPAHGHLPLIHNPGGTKMGKRDKAKAARAAVRERGLDADAVVAATGLSPEVVARFLAKKSDGVAEATAIAEAFDVDLPMIDVLDFRRAGYLPEALLNYMALLGWSPGDDREILTRDEMIAAFTLDRVTKTPARFDLDKLNWFNSQYLQQLPIDQLLVRLDQWLDVTTSPVATLDVAARTALLEMYRPRVSTFVEIESLGGFFFAEPTTWSDKQVRKHLDKGDGWARLTQARDALGDVGRWEAPSLHMAFETLCEATGVGLGKYAQPVRIAVTGTGVSPKIFETLAFLGRDTSLARIEGLLARGPDAPQTSA